MQYAIGGHPVPWPLIHKRVAKLPRWNKRELIVPHREILAAGHHRILLVIEVQNLCQRLRCTGQRMDKLLPALTSNQRQGMVNFLKKSVEVLNRFFGGALMAFRIFNLD